MIWYIPSDPLGLLYFISYLSLYNKLNLSSHTHLIFYSLWMNKLCMFSSVTGFSQLSSYTAWVVRPWHPDTLTPPIKKLERRWDFFTKVGGNLPLNLSQRLGETIPEFFVFVSISWFICSLIRFRFRFIFSYDPNMFTAITANHR